MPSDTTVLVDSPAGARGERPDTGHVPLEILAAADSPRLSGVDEEHARLLADLDAPLPPILVHRPTMRVVDGMHRLRAAHLRGCRDIEVRYVDGSEREAFVLAVEANIGHGLPLSLADRRASAQRILAAYPEWSNRAVAAKTGLSARTVALIRQEHAAGDAAQAEVTVGQDGRVRPLNLVEGRLRAREVLAVSPDASLREIARSAGVSVGTARDVRERVRRGESPLPGDRRTDPAPHREPARAQAAPADPATVLESLRKDPALRYNDEGRTLIRLLETRTMRPTDVDFMVRVPAHRASVIAAVARACATSWERIAAALEQQGE